MPKTMETRKGEESSARSGSTSRIAEDSQEQAEEESQETDKSAILKRLKAQGAVRVFPGMEAETPSRTEAPLAQEPVAEAPRSGGEAESSESESQESGGGGIDQAFHERVQKQTDAANNPAWYDLPQHIENARYGKWDLSQSRDRSGNRRQDANLEEDVRTNQIEKRLMPGTFDLTQKAKNAVNDVVQNPGQTAIGMIPLVGKGLKQKAAEKYDVKERDLLRGIAATSSNEAIKTSASSQARALGTKITSERVKAGIGTVTGLVGDLVPGAGLVTGAVSTAAGLAGDLATSGERNQVKKARAREEARRAMGKKEFSAYENIDEFIDLEKQRHALVAAGKGNGGATAPAVDSGEQVKRLTAHARGETAHHKYYKQRAKEVEKERAEAARPKTEEGGLMSRMKRFFGRS
ncbi:hypothetical protein [Cohnella zeiphila]|uniref:Uncharacterized protein n=1 Tax=Cohnella zeiphila TaxID=2761120 RepID=A0A7X0SQ38_9BACL|nr:hypothetical protein [Cohnella zeiphila]MBB6734090.1 hypothetical protein [Cohnella zeiphila]